MDDAHVAAVAALAEPTRRRLYELVARREDPVGRDEAAAETGLPRATAAFHLDRLVGDGLLDVVFQRRSGRSGPGAGRPAKLYRRSSRPVEISLPGRRYDLAGDLLAGALTEASSDGGSPRLVLNRRAYERGRALGATASGGREAVVAVLEEHGFEPRAEGDAITLVNCPFHALARDHAELVCGMNLRLLEGVLDAAGAAGLTARLKPQPGRCCVRLEPASTD